MDLIRKSGLDPVADRLLVHLERRCDLGDREELFGLGHRWTKPKRRTAGSRRGQPHRSDTRRWLQRPADPHRAAATDGAAQAGGHPNRQSLTDGHRLLPALRVKIGAAQGAAGRVWRDALAASGAVVNDHEKSPVSIMEIPHPWVIEIGL